MKRLWVIYNPRSSQHAKVQAEVLEPLRKSRGFMVGKYAIKPTSFRENVENVAKFCSDGDLALIAGGDGTVTMAMNGIIQSGKDVMVGVLGYGNFNDVAKMLGKKDLDEVIAGFLSEPRSESVVSQGADGLAIEEEAMDGRGPDGLTVESADVTSRGIDDVSGARWLYPIEILVNGKHWRYAISYMTMGLLARAAELMEEPKIRKRLEAGRRGSFGLLMMAVKWYLKNRKKSFGGTASKGRAGNLLTGTLNGMELTKGTTDYLAVNGASMARIMKTKGWWQDVRKFGSGSMRLGKFWRMVGFGLKSVFGETLLGDTEGDVIEFTEASTVAMQVEGELEILENVKTVEVRKAGRVRAV